MKQFVTKGIVLARTNFQEADRIVTLITPDHGKIRVLAKGVRKSKSKLAGGIELFSVADVTFLPGKGEIGTLISTRLQVHYGHIVKDIERTMLGYDLLKRLHHATEDNAGEEYFAILARSLASINDFELEAGLTELWFTMQLLKYGGHTPNLKTDVEGQRLDVIREYIFDFDDMAFRLQNGGPFAASHIKLLRLAYGSDEPSIFKQVKHIDAVTPATLALTKNILQRHIRI